MYRVSDNTLLSSAQNGKTLKDLQINNLDKFQIKRK